MNSHLAAGHPYQGTMCCPISEIPYDILYAIFEISTYDTTWDEYPQTTHVQGYNGSPLAVAMNLSQVCKKWRSKIMSTGCLWGRLLDTAYFPTYSNSLWKQVYRRAGESPIWLRHIDRTPNDMVARRLTQRQMYQFIHMFLLVVNNVPAHRIRRLELSIWYRELLWNLPARVKVVIREAVACHITHLKLGDVDHRDGLGTKNTDAHTVLVRRDHAEATSLMLLELVFGEKFLFSINGNGRSLRKLSIYGIFIKIEDLLSILGTTSHLEELHLEGSGHHVAGPTSLESMGSIPAPSDTIHLPFLRKIRIKHMVEMAGLLLPRITPCKMEVCSVDI